MPPSRLRRLSRVALAVVLLTPTVGVLWWLAARRAPTPSHFDTALDRALLPVMEQHEVQRELGAATPALARILARDLAQRSIAYLAPRDLELWQATRLRVAQKSPGACARLWQGGDTAFLGPAIAALGDDTLEAYTQMLARGLALRFEKKTPPLPSLGAIDHGLSQIASKLPDAERAGFEADVKRRDLDDARACQLFLLLGSGAEQLDPGERSEFLRALAGELQAAPR